HRQVVDQQVEGAADGEHVGVVVRLGPTVLAAPPGDRVLAGGDLPATLQHRMHVPVHDQVRDVHAHDVVRDELLLEAPQGEGPALADELVDPLDRLVTGELERQDRIGYRPVGDLGVDRQGLAAPVAACLQLLLDPDHHLRPAALALQGHHRDVLADVGGARGQGVAAQLGDRGVQPEGLLGDLLVPLTATVPADQRPAPDRVVDIGAATAGALVQPVAAARAGVDDAVSAVLLCGGLTGAAGSAGHARLGRALPARALRGGLAVAGLPGV